MRKLLIVMLLLAVVQVVHTQNLTNADSLKKIVALRQDESAIQFLCYYYAEGNNDSCIKYAQLLHEVSLKNRSKHFEAWSLFFIAIAEAKRGNLADELSNATQSNHIFDSLHDSCGISFTNTLLGVTYWSFEDDTSKVLSYFNKGLLFAPKCPALSYKGYPDWYGDYTKNFAHWFLAVFYFDHNQDILGLYYVQTFLELYQHIPDKKYVAPIFTHLGYYYRRKGNAQRALEYFRQAALTGLQNNNLTEACYDYGIMGEAFEKSKQDDSAYFYYKNSFTIADSIKNYSTIVYASSILTNFFKRKNKIDSAYKYQSMLLRARDSTMNPDKISDFQHTIFQYQLQQQQLIEDQQQLKNRINTGILIAGLVFFLIIAFILQRNNRHKQQANALLRQEKEKVEATLTELKSTQAQLIQREKMASLGELTAGIAHEIQNPLNFVNNFSELNTELIEDLQVELKTGNTEDAFSISNDLKENEQKIIHHGKRADSIVKSMLEHSKVSSGKKELTNINVLVNESLRLSYNGMRAKDKAFNATINLNLDDSIGKINIVPQDINRVLINLFNNAFYAVDERKRQLNGMYEPAVSVCTKKQDGKVEIRVRDNGNGIPQNIVDKIFQPFFTTKPTGQGTGLGLSLSYDIIKAHGGNIKVESKEEEGSEFIIQLPTIAK